MRPNCGKGLVSVGMWGYVGKVSGSILYTHLTDAGISWLRRDRASDLRPNGNKKKKDAAIQYTNHVDADST